MKFLKLILITNVIAFTACDSGFKQTDEEGAVDKKLQDLVGRWSTNECQNIPYEDGSPGPLYGNTTYNFSANGIYSSETNVWPNETCSGQAEVTLVEGPQISFVVGAVEVDENDIEITHITITVEGEGEPLIVVTKYTILDLNLLCTTAKLKLTTFAGSIGGVGDDIDYNNCVNRLE